MAELLIQILSTLALVLGIAAGESIGIKAFGMFKKPWLYIIEIALFVIGIVIIFNTFELTELTPWFLILMYFVIGLIIILFVRALMTGAGIVSDHMQKKVIKSKDEKDYIIGLKKSLERRGFEINDIKRIAKEVGYKKKTIDEVLQFFGHEPKKVVKRRKLSGKKR